MSVGLRRLFFSDFVGRWVVINHNINVQLRDLILFLFLSAVECDLYVMDVMCFIDVFSVVHGTVDGG